MTAKSRAMRTFAAALVVAVSVGCVPHDAEKEPTSPAGAAPVTASAPSDGSPPVLARAEPVEEPSGDAGAEVLKTSTLKGPYTRIEAYCQEGPNAQGQAVRCDLQPGGYGRTLSGGTSTLLEARLFSFRADLAGTKVSFCRIAVRTAAGWFVADPEVDGPCQGVHGPGATATTKTEALRFSDDGQVVVAIVRRESSRDGAERSIVLCGVGPSAIPSCTESVSIGCVTNDESRAFVESSWRFASSTLEIDRAPDESCTDEHYRVAFP
jgi:hypothetical protein